MAQLVMSLESCGVVELLSQTMMTHLRVRGYEYTAGVPTL